MKIKPLLIGLAVVAVLIGLRFAITKLQDGNSATVATSTQAKPGSDDAVESGGGWQEAPSIKEKPAEEDLEKAEADAQSAKLIEEYGFSPAKIEALRAAKGGDPRTPPLKRRAERVLPTAEELADPELYRQYEEAQTQQVFAGFVKAVDPKINQIRAHMASLEQYEVPDREKYQQIADEKIAALEKMKAELLEKNPELADVETPLLDLSQFEADTAAFNDAEETSSGK